MKQKIFEKSFEKVLTMSSTHVIISTSSENRSQKEGKANA